MSFGNPTLRKALSNEFPEAHTFQTSSLQVHEVKFSATCMLPFYISRCLSPAVSSVLDTDTNMLYRSIAMFRHAPKLVHQAPTLSQTPQTDKCFDIVAHDSKHKNRKANDELQSS